MKRMFILSAVLSLAVLTASGQRSVFIYAGQSNADGRDYVQTMPDYLRQGTSPYAPYKHLRFASICGNPAKSDFGSRTFRDGERYAFCDVTNYWIEQALADDFYAIKCAYGGTAIAPGVTAAKLPIWYADAEWMKTHYAYKGDDITKDEYASFNSLTKNLTEGFASLVDGTLSRIDGGYKVRAIMWHQGESDRTAASSYYVNFKTMIAYMRNALYETTGDEDMKTLPFIFGTVSRKSTQYSSGVEQAQKRVAAEDDNVYCIDMKDATLRSDNLHFDRLATEYLGKSMYNLMVELGIVDGSKVEVEPFPVKESVMDGVEVPSPDNRQWDFTSFSQATKDALAADVALETGSLWNYNNGWGYRRGGPVDEEQLHTAAGHTIAETEGLYFTSPLGNRVSLNTGKGFVGLVTGDPTVFIPKLTAGQLIYVTGQGNSSTVTIKPGLDMDDLVEVVGDGQLPSTGGTACLRVRHGVTRPTHIGFRTSGATQIKKIQVKTPETVSILIGADQTETFACDRPLDFSPFADLFRAFIVTGGDNDGGTVTIQQVEKVPARTGVLLIGEECTVNVPVIEAADCQLPAENLLTAVVGEGMAPAGSFTLATSHGVTQFSKTAVAQALTNQAYLSLPTATKDTYGFTVYEPSERLTVPLLSLTLDDAADGLKQVRCTLTSDNTSLKHAPDGVTYCYRTSDTGWQPIDGNVFTPNARAAYSFKAVADGYDDSEQTAPVALGQWYKMSADIDLTDTGVYAAATGSTGAFSWGWPSLPSGQEYGKLKSHDAISGINVQNNNIAARYSFAKGVGLANNYGYWLTATEGGEGDFAEYVFYQNKSLTDLTSTFVHNPKGVQVKFPSHTTGAVRAVRIYTPSDGASGMVTTVTGGAEPRRVGCFDLLGRRVHAPLHGVYVEDGRKVVR